MVKQLGERTEQKKINSFLPLWTILWRFVADDSSGSSSCVSLLLDFCCCRRRSCRFLVVPTAAVSLPLDCSLLCTLALCRTFSSVMKLYLHILRSCLNIIVLLMSTRVLSLRLTRCFRPLLLLFWYWLKADSFFVFLSLESIQFMCINKCIKVFSSRSITPQFFRGLSVQDRSLLISGILSPTNLTKNINPGFV